MNDIFVWLKNILFTKDDQLINFQNSEIKINMCNNICDFSTTRKSSLSRHIKSIRISKQFFPKSYEVFWIQNCLYYITQEKCWFKAEVNYRNKRSLDGSMLEDEVLNSQVLTSPSTSHQLYVLWFNTWNTFYTQYHSLRFEKVCKICWYV